MPVAVGVQFAHAAVQAIADAEGIDVLHIKGPALGSDLFAHEPSLGEGSTPRASFDADVLVRPSHVDRLLTAMQAHGWTVRYRFQDGSNFRHAATLVHGWLAPVDLHRSFPGFGLSAAEAFDRLWAARVPVTIAGVACDAPSSDAHRLILILHAVRSGDLLSDDIRRAWTDASPVERRGVQACADALGAEVALAAGTGTLGSFRDRRDYRLWRALATRRANRPQLWWAWVSAQPTALERVRVGLRLVGPRLGRLQGSLGHRPSVQEQATALAARVREECRVVAIRVARWARQ